MKAFIAVDLQNDFCAGGALEVPGGDQVVPVVNQVARRFDLVLATQDWHPEDHGSFADNHPGREAGQVIELDGIEQILWPRHCVQGTSGAAFHPQFDLTPVARVFFKGTSADVDSYSGFFDNARRRSTGLGDFLTAKGVNSLYVAGLATDYCVKYTVLDALDLGFETFVVEDGCRAVNLKPGDSSRALREMNQQGARVIEAKDLA